MEGFLILGSVLIIFGLFLVLIVSPSEKANSVSGKNDKGARGYGIIAIVTGAALLIAVAGISIIG